MSKIYVDWYNICTILGPKYFYSTYDLGILLIPVITACRRSVFFVRVQTDSRKCDTNIREKKFGEISNILYVRVSIHPVV